MFNRKIKIEKRFFLIFISIIFLLGLSGCRLGDQISFLFSKDKVRDKLNNLKENILPIINVEQPLQIARLLDGLSVEENHQKNLPVAIVFDNFPGAPRPTLVNASIVYEMPVEGGLTRFLAIFDLENLPQSAGPIRSARPYSAEIAEEYHAPYIHAGGSPDALFKLKQRFYNVFNLDEISGQGRYFYRQNSEPAPHNLYIKKENIIKFLEDSEISDQADFLGWPYDEETRFSDQRADNVRIVFSPIIESFWQYDDDLGKYLYLPNDKNYKDGDNQEILVKNLVVQYVPIKIIDEVGRREIDLTGQGKALIFQAGMIIEGKWVKEAGRTKFYNLAGEEITFLPGKTWVSIISPTNQVVY